jgi:choline dehydrogenase-like flavoprotein
VRYTEQGQPREARATREVLVSAGSINSPQLLELSGIGPPERLKAVLPDYPEVSADGSNVVAQVITVGMGRCCG